MYLLHVDTLKLHEFFNDQTPPYAILSHTWGDDAEELTLQDIRLGEPYKDGIGIQKIRGSCAQAKVDGLDYVWIDTCCIDKTNLVELSEAINSMYRWYQQAAFCYAFLWDVSAGQNPRDASSDFRRSRWFRRGWTLQELIAPQRTVFYSSDWTQLGTKVRLSAVIEDVTGIPHPFLRGISDIRLASVAQRMSWASARKTKRPEDMAYCLLGIFGITMPMIYGEGGEDAFIRLQEHIMSTTRDQSILAWGFLPVRSAGDTPCKPSQRLGFLASSPSEFGGSRNIVTHDPSSSYLDLLEIQGGDLRASVSVLTSGVENPIDCYALLNCTRKGNSSHVVAVPLNRVAGGPKESPDQFLRPRGSFAGLRSISKLAATGRRSTIHIRSDSAHQFPQGLNQQHGWVYNEDDLAGLGLSILEVLPRSSWDEERALIMSSATELPAARGGFLAPWERLAPHIQGDNTTSENTVRPTRVRLRQNGEGLRDFVLTLWFAPTWNSQLESAYSIDTIDPAISFAAHCADAPLDISHTQLVINNGQLSLCFTFVGIEGEPFHTMCPKDMEVRIRDAKMIVMAFSNTP